jgi:CrcB protein
MKFLWVFIGGGLGSVARYGLSRFMSKWTTDFPWGTFTTNVLASLVLALLVYQLPDNLANDWVKLFLITGFCGGFSTFSTFSLEVFQLFNQGNFGMAALYVASSVLLGFVAMFLLYQKA